MSAPFNINFDHSCQPSVIAFFDEDTNTFSYIVKDPQSNCCAIIDSVMNLDYPSATISFEGADQIIAYIVKHELQVSWILETHVHADHLSAAPYIQQRLNGKIGIGEHIKTVQEAFGKIFNEGAEFPRDGSQFDVLFKDEDSFQIGSMTAYALHTPGHTPACISFVIGDTAIVGDTLFMPDGGTARADFPGGDARVLYQSIQRLLSLPEQTRMFICHDYCPNGRAVAYQTTVAAEKENNIHVNQTISESDFVKMREARDATLGMPNLILPALQVNMRGGHLPAPENNGLAFLKLPINAFT